MHFSSNNDRNEDTPLSTASYSPVFSSQCHLAFVSINRNVKKNGTDRACGTYGRLELCVQGFVGDLSERVHLEDLGVDRIKILKWIFKKWDGA